MPDPDRRRLDQAVVSAGLAPTRARARDLIKRGFVLVDGKPVTKAGVAVSASCKLALRADAPQYVSRGGEKLSAALAAFEFSPLDRVALDVGASTGGFTEVLLSHGAATVYAVDVGTAQLHSSLQADPRVISLEQTDARSLDQRLIAEPVGAIVVDVSFISVLKVLPRCLALAGREAWLVVLIKPQFEAGPDAIGKGGIVGDAAVRQTVVDRVATWVQDQPGWRVFGVMPSPIVGGDGNQEFLLGATYDELRDDEVERFVE